MVTNIDDLNTEESQWVCNFYKACSEGKAFTESPPSIKAGEYIASRFDENGKFIGA